MGREEFDGALSIVRTIRAPVADVFDAWINPLRLRTWWGPPGVTVSDVEGVLLVGEDYRISMIRDGVERIELVWTFREISPPHRLVFDWKWTEGRREPDEQSVVTVMFRQAGPWTEVELTHAGIASPSTRDSHAAGWRGCFDELIAILTHTG